MLRHKKRSHGVLHSPAFWQMRNIGEVDSDISPAGLRGTCAVPDSPGDESRPGRGPRPPPGGGERAPEMGEDNVARWSFAGAVLVGEDGECLTGPTWGDCEMGTVSQADRQTDSRSHIVGQSHSGVCASMAHWSAVQHWQWKVSNLQLQQHSYIQYWKGFIFWVFLLWIIVK